MKYRITQVYAPVPNVVEEDTPEGAVDRYVRNVLFFINTTIYRVEEIDGEGVWEVDAAELGVGDLRSL
jgi:hypothetical protein